MLIYDSVKKDKIKFEPIKPKEVSLYVCGATVYDDAHLGHARSSLSFDILVRTLRELKYKVSFCKNITDIDDKIIAKVKESGKSLKEITEYYINRYNEDMNALGVIAPDIEPKATESIKAIISMIENLIDKGFAYRVENGDVYFDTSKDDSYGSISGQVVDNDVTQSRVESTLSKKNIKDFALWKACQVDEDICYDSSFSSGRPGWHIECSAMIDKYFTGDKNYTIDIHGGGADLLFPHHENEATQSRCSSGKELAKYWMHNGFVNIDGTKMSKSLGNSFFIRDALKSYDGEILRFYLISIHYRNSFNFNEEDLLVSKKRLDKLYRLKKRLPTKGSAVNREFKNNLLDAMSDDLNISKALSVIDEMVSSANDMIDKEPKNKGLKKEIVSNIEFINTLLGFGSKEPYSYFQIGVDEDTKIRIEDLISKRSEAKKDKNFELSDSIRDELNAMGVSLMDSANGTLWEI
ncbi:Cysteinyl-tRNA synthetase [hydrothermal vent metagenome]|uniref:cysteine--tRNA ligase n=1 Tax=hydrothermal vent metagenome TaxID=652676 RepID=A0A1W1EIR3_9ZZZZ